MAPFTLMTMLLSGFMTLAPVSPRAMPAYAPAPAPAAARFFVAPFVSKAGRFTITLPAGYTKPELETSEVPSDLGKIKLYMHTAHSQEGVCLIGYSDISNVEFNDELRAKMLEGAKEGAIENMHATLESEDSITLDGVPGRSIRFSAQNDGQTMHGRFEYYMVGNRLYQVGFIALTADGLGADAVEDYFKSFKITKKK